MGFFSFLWCASANHDHATDLEKQPEQTDERNTTSARGFLSNFCSTSRSRSADPKTRVEDSEQQKKPTPRGKPPKYNRHNLPSMVIEDPPPWVANHRKLEQRSDGTFFVTSLPQAEP